MPDLDEYIPIVHNTTELASLPTITLAYNTCIKYMDDSTNALVFYQLRLGGAGSVVPQDYDPITNNKSWFQC